MRQVILRCIPGLCLFAAGAACGWWYTRHTEVATLQLAAASQEVTIASLHKKHAELLERTASNTAKAVLANEKAANAARKVALDTETKLTKTAKASMERIATVSPRKAGVPGNTPCPQGKPESPGSQGGPKSPCPQGKTKSPCPQGKTKSPDAQVLADIDRPGPDSLVAPVRWMRDEAVRAGNSGPDACAVSAGSSFCPN